MLGDKGELVSNITGHHPSSRRGRRPIDMPSIGVSQSRGGGSDELRAPICWHPKQGCEIAGIRA